MTTTIAHMSDVHLAPLIGFGPTHLNLKRGLGLANWLLKRRKVHLRAVVDQLTADLARQPVDHIIVSGDLTNLGLPGEYAAALEWLTALGPPDRVTVVPGNHDVYCRLRRDPGIERWRPYMTSDEAGTAYAQPVERGFPFVRLIGDVALIGLISAIPTKPFYANGHLGESQLEALAVVLDRLARDGFIRVIIVHHPPLPGQADTRRGLVDAQRLEQVLGAHGAELVLHGHNHVDMLATRQWSGGPVHTVGVASASIGRRYKEEPLGRYNLICIERSGPVISFDIHSRGIQQPDGPVVEIGHLRLQAETSITARS